jgi:hypothetical protein
MALGDKTRVLEAARVVLAVRLVVTQDAKSRTDSPSVGIELHWTSSNLGTSSGLGTWAACVSRLRGEDLGL